MNDANGIRRPDRNDRRWLLAVIGVVAALSGGQCQGRPTESATGAPTARESGPVLGTVDPGDPRDWQVLFDGTAASGLRAYGGTGFPDAQWAIHDGRLWTVPGPGIDLIADGSFSAFELEFRWTVSPGGNGGVIYRAAETDDPAWTTGPEYQLLDDSRHPDGADPRTSAASVYDLLAPDSGKVLAPVGEDNEGRVVVEGGRVEHWLNGRLVCAYDWDGNLIRERVAASKFRDLPAFMSADEGHVVLQHHGEEVSFSLVRIRPLQPT